MFEEEMAEKLFRTEEENKLMNQHHDQTRQLEYKHMKVLRNSFYDSNKMSQSHFTT